MPRKSTKKTPKPVRPQLGDGVEILNAGSVLEDPITRTLEVNYMPYAMSVIVSRALPEIDGFKPAHRKLLYTMYEMGLLKGARTKSANIVGSTMHLNPHGDAAIYDTMVRMGRGNESLLVPFVDSKGNFGKAYSRDMSCAAARYTEAKLENVCEELFRDIDKETVDFVPNYDGTTTEPTLLPVTFPTILANNTLGIAVGMACNICSFNLAELCATTVALMKDPHHDIAATMPAPDFVGGGQILYDEAQMREIYEHGRGSVKVRARYNVVPGENMIEITQIPPTTTVEAIMDKIAELVKAGKIKEISDMRDETDLNGLKLTLDLKRGVDADKLMAKLFKTTPLEDSFSANFNILVAGQPRVMGVREILQEWTAFRVECVRRRTYYDLHGKEKRLHLLQGLAAILLDIDKAIKIIRTTEEESEVVPNLMIGFGIDEVQADYVRENIDTDALRQKYHADNVVYFFLFNTPYEHTPNPWSLGFSSSTDYDIEYVNLYIRFGDMFDAPPSTYAHEILHAFGAPDLYYESTVIPKEFVDYCSQTGCNDIMFTVNAGETIDSDFTPIDAYYVGIGARPAEADEWGLGPSEYDAN